MVARSGAKWLITFKLIPTTPCFTIHERYFRWANFQSKKGMISLSQVWRGDTAFVGGCTILLVNNHIYTYTPRPGSIEI